MGRSASWRRALWTFTGALLLSQGAYGDSFTRRGDFEGVAIAKTKVAEL